MNNFLLLHVCLLQKALAITIFKARGTRDKLSIHEQLLHILE